jgi:hypothetical protein
MDSVTINISPQTKKPLFKGGEVIKLKDSRRWVMVVKGVDEKNYLETTVNCLMKYKPSPKSQLRIKNVFSKNKFPLLNTHAR